MITSLLQVSVVLVAYQPVSVVLAERLLQWLVLLLPGRRRLQLLLALLLPEWRLLVRLYVQRRRHAFHRPF